MDASTLSIAEQEIAAQQFTVVEAAGRLKVSRSELYKMHGEKKIRFAKFRGRTLVPGVEVVRIIRQVAQEAA
jgi:excisionase family DNA binding protein